MARPFNIGDRVRLGTTRGGIVLTSRRVIWPDLTVSWVDHCEPDEDGPEGGHTRECPECGHYHRAWQETLCVNCAEAPSAPDPMPEHGSDCFGVCCWPRRRSTT